MHTVFALLCFVVVIHWLIFPYPSGLLHWHCGNLTIAPVPAKQPWWIWINTSCEFIMNDCIITRKQSTTKPCAYFLGYTVCGRVLSLSELQHIDSHFVMWSLWFHLISLCSYGNIIHWYHVFSRINLQVNTCSIRPLSKYVPNQQLIRWKLPCHKCLLVKSCNAKQWK